MTKNQKPIPYEINSLKKCENLVKELLDQINDEGLWFEAKTAPEAYLQEKLRKLHHLTEEYLKSFGQIAGKNIK